MIPPSTPGVDLRSVNLLPKSRNPVVHPGSGGGNGPISPVHITYQPKSTISHLVGNPKAIVGSGGTPISTAFPTPSPGSVVAHYVSGGPSPFVKPLQPGGGAPIIPPPKMQKPLQPGGGQILPPPPMRKQGSPTGTLTPNVPVAGTPIAVSGAHIVGGGSLTGLFPSSVPRTTSVSAVPTGQKKTLQKGASQV